MKAFKNIISFTAAIAIVTIAVYLLLKIFAFGIKFLLSFMVIVVILIIALPVYVIIKKKFFN